MFEAKSHASCPFIPPHKGNRLWETWLSLSPPISILEPTIATAPNIIHGFNVRAILENMSGSNVANPMIETAPNPNTMGQITVAIEIDGAFSSDPASGVFGPGSEGGIISESVGISYDQLCFRLRIAIQRFDRRYLNQGDKPAGERT